MFFKLLHPFSHQRRFFSRFLGSEDKVLLKAYEELGPSWVMISKKLTGRTAIDCRKRWFRMKEGGNLDSSTSFEPMRKLLTKEERNLILIDGYELPKSGNDLIRIPIDTNIKEPFYILGENVIPYRFSSQAKEGGWTNLELITLQEGFEQYGPKWDKIARILKHRTPQQCINQLIKLSINWNKDLISLEFPSASINDC